MSKSARASVNPRRTLLAILGAQSEFPKTNALDRSPKTQ